MPGTNQKTKTKNILIISSLLFPPLLSISSDDGARIYVDGKLIVDAWYDRAPAESSGTITLDVGRRHAITYQVRHSFFSLFISFLFFIFYIMFIHSLTFFQYYENGGGAVAQLRWSHACEAKAIVPQSQLFSA